MIESDVDIVRRMPGKGLQDVLTAEQPGIIHDAHRAVLPLLRLSQTGVEGCQDFPARLMVLARQCVVGRKLPAAPYHLLSSHEYG